VGTAPIGLLAAAGRPVEAGTLDTLAGVVAIAIERMRFLEERKSAELTRQSEELKTALLASLGHDLRTPLTAIRVAAGNLKATWLPEEGRAEQSDLILAEVERLMRLFNNVLEMARIDAGAVGRSICGRSWPNFVERSSQTPPIPGISSASRGLGTGLPPENPRTGPERPSGTFQELLRPSSGANSYPEDMKGSDFRDPEQIIHIPARDLTGTREAKLAELDMLLAQLQMVRLVLCGRPVRLEGFVGAVGQRPPHRSRLWSWVASHLRAAREAVATRTAGTKRDRS
jgi:hypothetical protein